MLKIELISFYRHYFDSEWHFSICYVENDFEYDVGRSLFSVGKKDEMWFLDLFWFKIFPR